MAGSMKTSPARPKPEAWAAHGHCHRVRLGHRTSHPPGPGGGRRGGDISRSRRRSSSDCPPGPVSGTAGPGAAAGCQPGRKRGRSIPDCRPYPRNAAPTGQQCAGTGSSGSLLAETSTKALDTVIRTDLYGPFFCCREFVKPPGGWLDHQHHFRPRSHSEPQERGCRQGRLAHPHTQSGVGGCQNFGSSSTPSLPD